MKVSVTGSKTQKDILIKEFDKQYDTFMYVYDPESSIGQNWYNIVRTLTITGAYTLNEYEAETFAEALYNFSAIIGGEFDLDLEYNQ